MAKLRSNLRLDAFHSEKISPASKLAAHANGLVHDGIVVTGLFFYLVTKSGDMLKHT